MASQRAEQKARTRARILDAARESFEAEGYEATTIAAVAKRAKVAAGTVMAHFPDKSALVAAAFHDAIEAVVQAAMQSAPGPAPAIERLLHVSGALYTFYARRPALSVALVREATFPEGAPKAYLHAQLERYLAWVAEQLAAGAARGELRPGLDLQTATLGYWADYYLVLLMGLMGGATPEVQGQTLEGLLRMRYT